MSVFEALRLTRAPMLTLAAVGLNWGGLAGLMPDIKAATAASDAQFGAALLAPTLGALIALFFAPRFGQWAGRLALPLAGLGTVLAILLPVLAVSPLTLGLVMFVTGGGVAMADITANVRIGDLEAETGRHLQSVNHAVFSLSFGLTAFSVALARQAGFGHREVLPLIALVALALVLLARDRRAFAAAGDSDDNSARPPRDVVLIAGFLLFAAFVGENAPEAWSALHIERTLGAPAGEGSHGPAVLGLVMFLGRLGGQFAAQRFGEVRLIAASAMLGAFGAVIIAAGPTKAVVLAGVGVLALGMAVIVPATTSVIGRAVSDAARPMAISRAWMAGLIGFFVGPAMMGGLAQLWSLRVSFAAVAVIVALILPAVLALSRRAAPGRRGSAGPA